MPLSRSNKRSLLRYASRLADQLSAIRPTSIERLLPNILAGVARRIGVAHAHLYLVSGRDTSRQMVRMIAEWSVPPHEYEIKNKVQFEPLALFAGASHYVALQKGVTLFSSLGNDEFACSRTVSSLLREVDCNGYEMVPIMIHQNLRAIFAFAHDEGPEHLEGQTRALIQLIGRLVISCWLIARREQRRQKGQKQWKKVADGACDFALRLDSALTIQQVIAFRENRPPDLQGLRLRDIVTPSSVALLMEEMREAMESGDPRLTEFRAVSSNGQTSSYAVRIEPDSTCSGGDVLLYLTCNDRERSHKEEVQNLQSQLERAARLSMLGNIATEFAHQLAQPLQAVSNHMFTMRSRVQRGEYDSEKQLLSISRIEDCLEHARKIISDVREFLKKGEMVRQKMCLRELMEKTMMLVQSQAEQQGVALKSDDVSSKTEPLYVYADPGQVTHVLTNLMINAIEAMAEAKSPSPLLKLKSGTTGSRVHAIVDVIDNGPGIREDRLDAVFERFFSTKSEGFGIGLAMCRDIVERQGGSISVRNNAERGCTFTFTIPLYIQSEEDSSDDQTRS